MVAAPHYACAEKVWRHATSLADDPEGIELMLCFHALPEGEQLGRCIQCTRPWPCVPWQVATLARILHISAPSHRRRKSISWFGRQDSAVSAPFNQKFVTYFVTTDGTACNVTELVTNREGVW